MEIEAELLELKSRIGDQLRQTPDTVDIFGWTISYVNNMTLLSSLEVVAQNRWNDFMSRTDNLQILDCGAHNGITDPNYKRKHANARIIAFEPDPSILPYLKRNLNLNQASDVVIVESAVSTTTGDSDFLHGGRRWEQGTRWSSTRIAK